MDSDDNVTQVAVPKKAVAGTTKKKAAATKTKAPTKPKGKAAAKPKAKKKKGSYDDDSDEDEDLSTHSSTFDDEDEDMDNVSGEKPSIEQIYQKKTQLEHILLRPDTYVGSIEPVTQNMWVFDTDSNKMELRKITYVPGLYKIFDEIIVNACDNKQRDKSMDTIRVTIDAEKGEISVWNNGKGIPVVMHKEHKVYVPELIFGHLLTGSNFDDKKKKTTGGRNGYGAKLANIFSNEFIVETADSNTKQRYKQVFSANMSKKEPPVISSYSKKDFTCITFKPDLERFKMTHLDNDIVALFKKRVYDVAGVTDKTLSVYLNDEKISIRSFPEYVRLYPLGSSMSGGEDNANDGVIFDKPDARWHVGVSLSDDGFQQVSFVNGICTTKGGQHVNYIIDQIATKLIAVVKKKNKGEAVKPNYIKNHMTVYVSALIDNPAFDSQTKETLTTRSSAFGSTYTLSDKFLKQIEKSGMVERILSFAQFKQTAELRRKGGATAKKSRLTGITKLDDANFAGTSKSQNCTLIVTEGDSAKTIAVGGLSVVGRDYYGVFPLRGKLLNVREASHSQILKNEEIQNLVKILGLKYGEKYESTKGLRYGHLMIMADQDHDGSHIKGLVINFIHHFWPSLLETEGFIQEFITPIVKCTKNKNTKVFYTIPEYEAWRVANNNGRGWNIKYYKGLGTSTTHEAKEYFSDLGTHQIGFVYDGEQDGDSIDMAFSKKRVEERKDWLRGYEAGTHVDYDVDEMAYSEFVNKELILFSRADNLRSIPSVVDGFKPSQRKVLFCCFKRNLKSEIKVAQLAGYVSEHSAYHHGEQSLNGTIINMAQDFVGSNNIHLLSPNGQFGTRLMGGKDAASPRYIFTKLEQLTRQIFDPLDNDVLTYLDDDGQSIEPEYYVPIIPMALVNGSEGIGTGWSSSIPNYNPQDIIQSLRCKIKGEEMAPLKPWYRGFTGHILEKSNLRASSDSNNFVVQGVYEVTDDNTLVISELPVKSWTQSYKQFLESLLESDTIKDFKENHTDATVLFTITMDPSKLREISNAPGGIIKKFKLESSISTSNMHLFDAQGRIKKYETPEEILNEFYDIRLDYYNRRKASMLQKLSDQIKLLSNKSRFVLSVVNGELVVNNRKKQDLLEQLIQDGYDQILPKSTKSKKSSDDDEEDTEEEEGEEDLSTASRGFDYLLSMKIMSLTKERVDKLRAELQEREQEYQVLEARTIQDLWLADLDSLEVLIKETEDERARIASSTPTVKKGGKRRKPAGKSSKKSKKNDSDDDDDSDYEVAPAKSKAKAKAKAPAKPSAKKEEGAKKAQQKKDTKTPSITSFFSNKEAPQPTTKAPEKEKDVEMLSLAERLARRVQVIPKKDSKLASKRARKQHKMIDLAISDDDDDDDDDQDMQGSKSSDNDADDVFAMDLDDVKNTKPVSKPDTKSKAAANASGKSRAKAPPKAKKPAKSDNDASEPVPSDTNLAGGALKRKKEKALKTAKSAAPALKKQKLSKEESKDEDEDMKASSPILRRGTRTRKTITYENISSDDDGNQDAEEEEVEETKKKPTKSSKSKASYVDPDEGSEFSEVDDNDSDYE